MIGKLGEYEVPWLENPQNPLRQGEMIPVRMVGLEAREGKLFLRRDVNSEIETSRNNRVTGVSTWLEHVGVDSSAWHDLGYSRGSCCRLAGFA